MVDAFNLFTIGLSNLCMIILFFVQLGLLEDGRWEAEPTSKEANVGDLFLWNSDQRK